MDKKFFMLEKCLLFNGIKTEDIEASLHYLGFSIKNYKKDEIILLAGNKMARLGIILAGQVDIDKEDALGNRSIVTQIWPGEIFAEAIVCAAEASPVTVVAATDAKVIFLSIQMLLTGDEEVPAFCARLVSNLLKILSYKNIELNRKIEYLSLRTIREKILAYLLAQHKSTGKNPFTIPFDRNQLAAYLCVDRSAMSRELGRMRDEKIVKFKKNLFTLNKKILLE